MRTGGWPRAAERTSARCEEPLDALAGQVSALGFHRSDVDQTQRGLAVQQPAVRRHLEILEIFLTPRHELRDREIVGVEAQTYRSCRFRTLNPDQSGLPANRQNGGPWSNSVSVVPKRLVKGRQLPNSAIHNFRAIRMVLGIEINIFGKT